MKKTIIAIGLFSSLAVSAFAAVTPTTTVACTANPVSVYAGSSCTVTVTGTGGNKPTGTVTFSHSGTGSFNTTICVLSGSGHTSTCSVTYTPSAVGTGSHTITASFPGDANYNAASGNTPLIVNPIALTVSGITASNKTYDGTTAATLSTGGATLNGVTNGDNIVLHTNSATGAFSDKNVGTGKTVTISGTSITGSASSNYTLTQPTTTANITAATLTYTANSATRAYGAANPSLSGTVTGFVSGDTQLNSTSGTLSFTTPAVANSLVGTYAITGSGLSATNYTFSQAGANTAAFSITKANAIVNVSGYTGIYDGTPHGATGSATGVLAENLSSSLSLGATYTNVPGGTATWAFTGGTNYNNQNGSVAIVITAGSQTINVTTAAPVAAEYNSTFPVAATAPAGTVAVTTTGVCSITGGTVTMTSGTGTCTVHFNQAGAGSYSAAPEITEDVTATPITTTATITANGKVYDTNNAATVATCSLSGVVNADDVICSAAGATFDDQNVGTGKTVTATGISLSGTTAGNYQLSSTSATAQADITAYALTVSATAGDKTYDTSTAESVFTTTVTGLGADDVTATGGTASFDGANAGSHTVTVSGYSLTGAASGNYSITNPTATASAAINKADPVITWATPADITFDTALSGTQLNASADVAGSFVYTPPTGTVLTVGNSQTLHTDFTPTDTTDYNNISKNVTINDLSASSVTTVTCSASVIYNGSAQTPCTVSVTGTGGLSLTPSAVYTNNVNAGTANASYTYVGDANHTGSSDNKDFSITKADQTITFGALSGKTLGDADFTVSATSDSNLAVSFISATSAVCTVTGSTVHLVTNGTCTVTAQQAGNSNYNAATDASQSFTVSTPTPKAITAFDIAGELDSVIDEVTHTILVTMPLGTNVTALVPTITVTGVSLNPASGTANDFTHPKSYTVTGTDSTTQSYSVKVQLAGITPATGGSAISDSTAGGTYTALTGPTIDEAGNRDISAGTIVLTAPTGFEFDPAATVTVSVTRLDSGSHTLLTLDSNTAVVTSGTITTTVTANDSGAGSPSTKARARLAWSGITVRPIAGTTTAAGTMTDSGTAAIAHVTGTTNFGTLTEITSGGPIVPVVTLSSIAITTPATKLAYTVGDTLDITGMVVTGTYSDASTAVLPVTAANVTGFDSSLAATGQTLTVTYQGQTATYTVDINPVTGSVTVTGATGGESIATTTAGLTYTALTGPTLSETTMKGIGTGDIVLTAPTGFEFDPTATVTVLVTGDANANKNINHTDTGSTIPAVVTSSTITVTITHSSTVPNVLTWQGITVRPTAGTTDGAGNIAASGATIKGVTGSTNFGTLAEEGTTPVTLTHALTYTTDGNGSITGSSTQVVNDGTDGTAVTATPNAGFHFANWSDTNSTADTRTDTHVTADITAMATFAADAPVVVVAQIGGAGGSNGVPGCMDPKATNYDVTAIYPGSCTYPKTGEVLGASTSTLPVGEVLGASTSTMPLSCSEYLTFNAGLTKKALREGAKNDKAMVVLLQRFLNENLGTKLPVTGVFGPMTTKAVKQFQLLHKEEVLTPWKLTKPTGIVYITTIAHINNTKCPSLNATIDPKSLVPATR
jgi:hypothetical protein